MVALTIKQKTEKQNKIVKNKYLFLELLKIPDLSEIPQDAK